MAGIILTALFINLVGAGFSLREQTQAKACGYQFIHKSGPMVIEKLVA